MHHHLYLMDEKTDAYTVDVTCSYSYIPSTKRKKDKVYAQAF